MEPQKTTIIDAQANVDGRLGGADAQIHGTFKGEIELTGRLLVGPGARVEAKVRAASAEVAGHFKGELTARHLVVQETGRIEGTLTADRIAVREGAQINGSVSAGADQTPAARASGAVAG